MVKTKNKTGAATRRLTTINSYHNEHGVDRRTVAKYIAEAGLEPVSREGGLARYDEDALTRVILERHPAHVGESRGAGRPKDALKHYRSVFEDLTTSQAALRSVEFSRECNSGTYLNLPANHESIQKVACGDLLKALNRLGDLIGRDADESTNKRTD